MRRLKFLRKFGNPVYIAAEFLDRYEKKKEEKMNKEEAAMTDEQKYIKLLEDALRPFAELVQYELSDLIYPPGSMGYHNETEMPDATYTRRSVTLGQIRDAARLLKIPIPKFDPKCLEKVPKYCPDPINHDRHQSLYCARCTNLCCHEYYFGALAKDDALTYHRCFGCRAIVGYSSNQDGR